MNCHIWCFNIKIMLRKPSFLFSCWLRSDWNLWFSYPPEQKTKNWRIKLPAMNKLKKVTCLLFCFVLHQSQQCWRWTTWSILHWNWACAHMSLFTPFCHPVQSVLSFRGESWVASQNGFHWILDTMTLCERPPLSTIQNQEVHNKAHLVGIYLPLWE